MRALDRGEVSVVTRNGIPVGELRPARRRFVSRDVLIETLKSAPEIEPGRFRADVDAALDQDIEPHARALRTHPPRRRDCSIRRWSWR